jgi:LPXTG-motif cell wall-anchored protein
MEAVILFGFILVILGVAFAVPMASLRGSMVADRDASVLGASILVLGMGSLNYGFLVWFVITGEMDAMLLAVGLAPLAAGGLGLLVTRRRETGIIRAAILLAAGGLTVAGLPGYFAFNVAILLVAIAVIAFVSGLLSNPRSLARRLDPRL